MRGVLHQARRSVAVGVGIIVTGICLSGCEPGKDFSITNSTGQTLTVVSRLELSGQTPAATPGPFDVKLTLLPGQKQSVQIDLSRGVCKNLTYLAYDQSGHLVADDPSPICEDSAGHGNSWTIKTK